MAKTKSTIQRDLVSVKKLPSGKTKTTVIKGKPKEMKMKSITAKEFYKK